MGNTLIQRLLFGSGGKPLNPLELAAQVRQGNNLILTLLFRLIRENCDLALAVEVYGEHSDPEDLYSLQLRSGGDTLILSLLFGSDGKLWDV